MKLLKPLSYMLIVYLIITFSTACFANGSMMQQSSSTSQGTIQRYIDVSSPVSGSYYFEEMTIVGSAEIKESFQMNDIRPGSSAAFGSTFESDIGFGSGNSTDVITNNRNNSGPDTGSTDISAGSKIEKVISIADNSDHENTVVLGSTTTNYPNWFDLF